MSDTIRHVTISGRVQALQDEAANPDLLNLRGAGERFSVLPTI